MKDKQGNNKRSYRLIAVDEPIRSLVAFDADDDKDAIMTGAFYVMELSARDNASRDRCVWAEGSVTLVDWQGNFVANMREVVNDINEEKKRAARNARALLDMMKVASK
jgi:hypothetical protein